MVEEHDDRPVCRVGLLVGRRATGGSDRQQGADGCIRAREVVQARRGDELLGAADAGRRLGVVEHRIPGEHVTRVGAHLLPEVCRDARWRLPHPPQGHQVLLRVEDQTPLVDAAVQMDRELGDPQEGGPVVEQPGRHPSWG